MGYLYKPDPSLDICSDAIAWRARATHFEYINVDITVASYVAIELMCKHTGVGEGINIGLTNTSKGKSEGYLKL